MSGVIDLLFGSKKDPIQVGAWKAIKGFQDQIKVLTADGLFKTIQLKNESLVRIVENDPNSPILINISENKKLIYYPENSTPYENQVIGKCKFIRVIDGCIYDENSGQSLKVGDTLKIRPSDNYRPYTKNCKAIVEVCFDDCNKKIESICG
jgi:hypothetical protein